MGPAYCPSMVTILQDPTKSTHLKVDLACIVDAGKQSVLATYNQKCDGPLARHCYKRIKAAFNMIQIPHFPNTDTIIKHLAIGDPSHSAVAA